MSVSVVCVWRRVSVSVSVSVSASISVSVSVSVSFSVSVSVSVWPRGVVVITTKPELRFCAGSNPACGVSEIRDDEDI